MGSEPVTPLTVMGRWFLRKNIIRKFSGKPHQGIIWSQSFQQGTPVYTPDGIFLVQGSGVPFTGFRSGEELMLPAVVEEYAISISTKWYTYGSQL